MTVGEFVDQASGALASLEMESPRLEAQLLAAHVFGRDRSWVLAHLEEEINDLAARRLLERRLAREPLAYILGRREFYGYEFEVGPGVLIPRQETECLVEVATELAELYPELQTCLDVGVGSGCVAVSVALQTQLGVTGIDVSATAMEFAHRNAARLGARLHLIESDRFSALGDRTFDLVLSNPPYVGESEQLAPELHDHEPHVALYAGEDGLDAYRWLARDSILHTKPTSWIAVEIGLGQSRSVVGLFEQAGWDHMRSIRDLSQIDRVCVFARVDRPQ